MKFTQKLAEYLSKRKIPVQVFADSLGVHNSAVYGYLSGKYEPGPETAKKIRDLTNKEITLDDIYN